MTERKRPKRGSADYEVGYAKPPVATRFKKGQPRPPRKPKAEQAPRAFQDFLAEELNEPMRIIENGVEQVVPKGKALAKASIKGAMDDRDPRRLKGFLAPSAPKEEFDFSETDITIVARALAQILKQQSKPASPREEETDTGADEVDGEAPQ
ncbi:hypothetical protein [Novosphingobium ginsenosidimutans]|uniref:DUF5681 domain-containing protein n=1 Tax=Novosphingobium ginsenosidimutans TaxID=1176536 RepID=A0A5B8S4G8_9SPHN|nr:hypothetical protein [Novosphingobium ginsenosidimutans]QEA16449.1 hypothetical protein FRF71_10070 [Novosphingobium ginsenosidimutans]